MVKPDELEFRRLVMQTGKISSELWPSLSKKQFYWLNKWTDKGWWEYGVSMRSGWLTENGKKEF